MSICVFAGLAACGDPPEGPDGGGGDPDAHVEMDASGGDGASTSECEVAADCDDGAYCNGSETCASGTCTSGAPPCSTTMCDEAADACSCLEPDMDGDGASSIACGGDDCDDDDETRHPSNPEVCDPDDHDEDCDLETFGALDSDGDGAYDAACCNGDGTTTHCGTDCDDAVATTHPTAPEVCDDADNDCDGATDERVLRTFYPDADGDGFGVAEGTPVMACFPPDAHSEMVGDCDDDPATGGAVHPGAPDVCDVAMVDDDCNGTPNDPPGGCTCTGSETRDCVLGGLCAAGQETCTDGTWGECSVQPVDEICNGVDEDCDGTVDDGVTVSCFLDVDDDTYAGTGATVATLCPDEARTSVGRCPAGYTNRAPLAPAIDCDELTSTRSPGAAEICNGIDEDCDGAIDDGVTVTCYADADGDLFAGFGTAARQLCPDPSRTAAGGCPVGYTGAAPGPGSTDCDDASAVTYPGASESCNLADDDCDGLRDEGTTVDCYADTDGDTYVAPGSVRQPLCPDDARTSVGRCPVGYSNRAPAGLGTVDCDDLQASISPAATESCNTIDDDCDGSRDEGTTVTCYVDTDGDTYAAAGTPAQQVCPDASRTSVGSCPVGYTNRAPAGVGSVDCNDLSGTRSPGQTESCNTIDDDCDGSTDEGTTVACYVDADGDTYAPASASVQQLCPATGRPAVEGCPVGYTNRSPATASDCDDTRASRSPAASESLCDGLDDNCNGSVDEGVQTLFYRDADNDTYGNSAVSTLACSAPSGFVADRTDCNDSVASIHPTAPEVCNCVDDDCDLVADDSLPTVCVWRDADGDDYGDAASAGCDAMRCVPPTGPLCDPQYARGGGDCNDGRPLVYPGAPEVCLNAIDDDCNGMVDDNTPTWYEDLDRDGYGDDTVTVQQCSAPTTGQWTNRGGDCDPTRDTVYPGAPELCDGLDTDCDVNAGSGEAVNAHGLNHPNEDNDGDGHGDVACPGGGADPLDDCDDTNATVHPGAVEAVGNGIDNDCDGGEVCFVDGDSDGHRSTSTGSTVTSADADCDDAGEGRASEPADDCNDAAATVYPGANEVVGNGVDNDCNGSEVCYLDADDDGHRRPDGATLASADVDCTDGDEATASDPADDCDDGNEHRYPGNTETVGNEVDNDCSGGEICFLDYDDDGYRPNATATQTSADADCTDTHEARASEPTTDCDDSRGDRFPGNPEIAGNEVDNDCSGGETCFRDADDDGYRQGATATQASADADCADSGEARASEPTTDCDDSRADRFPGNPEIAGNEVDNDCNGWELCFADADDDGYRPNTTATVASTDFDCADAGEARASEPTTDCDDTSASRHPGLSDAATGGAYTGNGIDNDCNGQEICYLDADDDGYRSSGSGSCVATSGCAANHVCASNVCRPTVVSANASCTDAGEALASDPIGDCVDSGALGPSINPGQLDTLGANVGNGIDNDCNGQEVCYANADGDGYRTSSTVTSSDSDCSDAGEALASLPSGDCCDSENDAYPGQTAWFTTARTGCGGYDYDCNGANTRRYPSVTDACQPRSVPGSSCIQEVGWSSAVPACGASGTYQTGCSASGTIVCLGSTTSRTQSCH